MADYQANQLSAALADNATNSLALSQSANEPSTGGATPTVDKFRMMACAIASTTFVSWVATGTPDVAGAGFPGPGVVDVGTIRVIDAWTE